LSTAKDELMPSDKVLKNKIVCLPVNTLDYAKISTVNKIDKAFKMYKVTVKQKSC